MLEAVLEAEVAHKAKSFFAEAEKETPALKGEAKQPRQSTLFCSKDQSKELELKLQYLINETLVCNFATVAGKFYSDGKGEN